MNSRLLILQLAIISVIMTLFCGCSNDHLDPSQIGRFRPVPVVNVILDSLGVADEPDPVYAGAEDPRPEDLLEYDIDYTFAVGDVIRVTIWELRRESIEYVNDFTVTETGRISIPDVGLVRAEGLTESELESEIKDILSPSILLDPSVSVTLLSSTKRTFSISGNGIQQPGRYIIPRDNYRLTEAVAVAGGVAQFNVSNIYVTRELKGSDLEYQSTQGMGQYDAIPLKEVEKGQQTGEFDPKGEMMEVIAPYANKTNYNKVMIAAAEMVSAEELENLAAPEGFEDDSTRQDVLSVKEALDSAGRQQGRIEWVFEDGKWVPIRIGDAPETGRAPQPPQTAGKTPSGPGIDEDAPKDFGWEQLPQRQQAKRVIRIPVDSLLGGDPRYDIVIRAGDTITIPVDLIGEFWVMGNVNAQGPISLTGRPMTLKMAIASAGGLGPLAWPKKVEVIRRIGRNKEEIVMVDLEKIAKGQQPDFFIKPYDLINVGTHGTSRYLATLRNAFTAQYGFGFTYTRNFANVDFNRRGWPSEIGELFW